jgi:16S rRNA (guanine527-N7)-methyltransferase
MDPARISALLEPFLDPPLPSPALEHISIYIDILQQWNARINLTAIRAPEEIVTRHFGESLFLARHVLPLTTDHRPPTTVSDIGSGAGFPGLPLKIWAPEISLTLIESNHKKAAFLREVSRKLTLTNVNVITQRAEAVTTPADVVTLRAVERFDQVLPTARRLVALHGRLALLIGTSQVPTLETEPLFWYPPIPIPNSQSRVLAIGVRQS